MGYGRFLVDDDLYQKSDGLGNIYIDSQEYFINQDQTTQNLNWYISASSITDLESLKNIVDNSDSTYYSMQEPGYIELTLKNPSAQSFNKINIQLDNSELNNVEFYDVKNNKPIVYVSDKNNFLNTYTFDNTLNTDEIRIQISFDNILKISEIRFINDNTQKEIMFFINNECSRVYKLYYGGFGENFFNRNYNNYGIIDVKLGLEKNNFQYIKDFDKDNALNEEDNCLYVYNPDQKDINQNGIGEACEDFDNDGIINNLDNCQSNYNPDKTDIDNDGIGDACDAKDDRFSEKYSWMFYTGAIIIVALFTMMGYLILNKK